MSNTVIVYEEPQTAQLVKTLLKKEGYVVLLTSSSDDVAALGAVHRPWLVVLGEEVFDLSRIPQLREQLANDQLPVLVLDKPRPRTGDGNMRGYAHGADMHLDKPINPQELVQFARRLRAQWEKVEPAMFYRTSGGKDGDNEQ